MYMLKSHFRQDEIDISVSRDQASCNVNNCHHQGTKKWQTGSKPRPAWTRGPYPKYWAMLLLLQDWKWRFFLQGGKMTI